jgi:hypothetical protein
MKLGIWEAGIWDLGFGMRVLIFGMWMSAEDARNLDETQSSICEDKR